MIWKNKEILEELIVIERKLDKLIAMKNIERIKRINKSKKGEE